MVNFIKLSFHFNTFILRDYLHSLMTITDIESESLLQLQLPQALSHQIWSWLIWELHLLVGVRFSFLGKNWYHAKWSCSMHKLVPFWPDPWNINWMWQCDQLVLCACDFSFLSVQNVIVSLLVVRILPRIILKYAHIWVTFYPLENRAVMQCMLQSSLLTVEILKQISILPATKETLWFSPPIP